eukprot:SAG31_NODE_1828_length_7159_cov_58.418980_3_plen_160_part_00
MALARLPAKVKRFSILKAPFKYHKHFEAFQFKTYKRLVTIKDLPFEEESHMEHIAKQVCRFCFMPSLRASLRAQAIQPHNSVGRQPNRWTMVFTGCGWQPLLRISIVVQLPAGINLRVTVERPLSIPLPKLKAKNDAPPAEIQMDQSGIPVPNRVPTLR